MHITDPEVREKINQFYLKAVGLRVFGTWQNLDGTEPAGLTVSMLLNSEVVLNAELVHLVEEMGLTEEVLRQNSIVVLMHQESINQGKLFKEETWLNDKPLKKVFISPSDVEAGKFEPLGFSFDPQDFRNYSDSFKQAMENKE